MEEEPILQTRKIFNRTEIRSKNQKKNRIHFRYIYIYISYFNKMDLS